MNSIQQFLLKTSEEYKATESFSLSPIYELNVQQLNKIGEILKQCIALESISFSRSGIANLSQQQWKMLSHTFQKMAVTSLDFDRNELNKIDKLSWKAYEPEPPKVLN